jgi:hypothetical protein
VYDSAVETSRPVEQVADEKLLKAMLMYDPPSLSVLIYLQYLEGKLHIKKTLKYLRQV